MSRRTLASGLVLTAMTTLAALLLAACASAPPASLPLAAPLSAWSERPLPGKRPTVYAMAQREGRACMLGRAQQSVSLWRRSLDLAADQVEQLRFAVWIGEHAPQATVTASDTDDAPARILLGFDGDEDRLSMSNRMQFELVRTLTGEAPPFATLMYVWDASAAPETLVVSARSDRIRKIVVGSGRPAAPGWQQLQRDVQADYRRAFGEAPGRLVSLALMTDSDNTRSRSEACYGDIELLDVEARALDGSLHF